METLRTPDDRFAGLPDFGFAPHYVEIDDLDGGTLRVHHLDEGPADAEPVLLMHGEPSWCYLYRHMIPPLVAAGHRVIAPDLVGFGRSDKPTRTTDYTYARHVEWMRQVLFDHLDLRSITFFGQDWGGLLGLRLVALQPERYARLVLANTSLPTGRGTPSQAFLDWQRFSQQTEDLPIGRIVAGACVAELAPEVVAAYEAPFPDPSYKAGARIFPMLVPTSPDDPAAADNAAAWEVLERFDRPVLTAFSDSDPVTAGDDGPLRARIPGAAGQPHTTIEGAGHFLQEERGPRLARLVDDFVRSTR